MAVIFKILKIIDNISERAILICDHDSICTLSTQIYCLDSGSSYGFVFINVFANRYTAYILYVYNFEHF